MSESPSTSPTTSSDPDAIRAEIERTRSDLSRDVDALGDTVNPKTQAKRQAAKVKDVAGTVKDRVMGAASDAKDSGGSAVSGLQDTVTGAPHDVSRATRGNPLAAGLIAFGLGALASSLIPTSRREQQAAAAVKEKAQPLVHETTDAAKRVVEEVKPAAGEAVSAVKETAAEGAESVKDEARSGAEDVRSDAASAKDAVQNS